MRHEQVVPCSGTAGAPAPGLQSAAARAVDLDRKLAALSDPATFPDRPARVDLRQTHLSWLIFTDRHVYKLKKPGFDGVVDFRSTAARGENALTELQLNRRLAPAVYDRVVALTLEPGSSFALDGPGVPVDWLVKMKRLDPKWFLDRLIVRNAVSADAVGRVAALLVPFYRHAERYPVDPQSLLETYRWRISECRAEMVYCTMTAVQTEADRVHSALWRYLETRPGSLLQRAALLRDTHGDLRPEHIHLGEPVAIIDCLEFSRALRILDPLEELSYLAMECQGLGNAGFGAALLNQCCQGLKEDPPGELLAFYMSFRAFQRARLCFRRRTSPDDHSPHHWISRAAGYLAAASGYARKLPASRSVIEPS